MSSNGHFQRLFTHLFGGGTAELQLIESEDPLEAGLEILARPPGKKPQTMTLLSGGEQALTAMALIFAVFLTNPAPICVLDEVDAPLDDHNVERFCNLMDEMARTTETRFVIITHNPITMSRMNRLFGVTMAEQGVSQLVSVDLQTAEQMREASFRRKSWRDNARIKETSRRRCVIVPTPPARCRPDRQNETCARLETRRSEPVSSPLTLRPPQTSHQVRPNRSPAAVVF
jgi:ABC-type multidrug transport system ATPase subunit